MLRLRPKTFAVLRYLAERDQQLVTKDQLLNALWPDTYVTDSALKSCIRELRRMLDDDPKAPQFIETVHRRGYRFMAPTAPTQPVQSSRFKVQSSDTQHSALGTQSSVLVGREPELTQLQERLDKAASEKRQVVFITGEAGVGKTAIVDAFVEQIKRDSSLWIGHGQCIEHYGVGEPYMPVLEALGRLCRGPEGNALIALLGQYAPTWLVQMPGLLSVSELNALQIKVRGSTQERMLREMAEAVEVLTSERPLLLILEDVHWSDYSTVALLSVLARRREPARLLIIGTYRPAEILSNEHPLRGLPQELQLRGYSHELLLKGLSRSAVAEYLFQRFPQHQFPPRLVQFVYKRTEGSPLFMINVVDALERQAILMRVNGQWTLQKKFEEDGVDIPGTLKQVIEQQIDNCEETARRILEAASVVGLEFSSAAVAAGLTKDLEAVEACCEKLVRQQRFLQSKEPTTYPNGTRIARYSFVHALHQDVLYRRLSVQQRAQLHRRIGEWEERQWGDRAGEIAAVLAMHFENGQDARRAVKYHKQAAENALRRSAHQEALVHFSTALKLLSQLPDSSERIEQELALQLALAVLLGTTRGYGASEVKEAYQRAQALCQELGDASRLFPALAGLAIVNHMQGNLRQAHEIQEQLLRLARDSGKQVLLLWAHLLYGATSYNRGQLTIAESQLTTSLAFYDPHQHKPQVSGGREDPGVLCLTTLASTLWLLGYPTQALQRMHEALMLAEKLADPPSQAMALGQAAVLHQRCRDGRAALESSDLLIALAHERALSSRIATGMVYRGWALAECEQMEEGLAQLHAGLEAIRATGAALALPYYLALLAEVHGKVGQVKEALRVLQDALTLAQANDDRFYEAEVWRLKGELMLQKLQASGSEFQVRTKKI